MNAAWYPGGWAGSAIVVLCILAGTIAGRMLASWRRRRRRPARRPESDRILVAWACLDCPARSSHASRPQEAISGARGHRALWPGHRIDTYPMDANGNEISGRL